MAVRNPSSDDDKFLGRARDRYHAAYDYWMKIYTPAKAALEFYSGEQWPQNIRQQRESDVSNPRPVLTINRLPLFHNQIVNAYRQATLSIKASPQEDNDVETARVYEGLFRQIEKQSFAQSAYIKALSDATIHSVGYIRVLTDYANSDSFNQDIYIKREVNPFRHFPDPKATDFFLEDSQFWFVIDKISESEYDEGGEYADFDPADFTDDNEYRNEWRSDDKEVTIAEYFYFKTEKDQLHLLTDGSTVFQSDIDALKDEDDKKAAESVIEKSRDVDRKVLWWCKIDGYNVLEKPRRWAKPRIPIIPIWGNELWVGEQRNLTGITQGSMDSCRMYNYWQSAKTEMIALAPKSPYMVAEGQLENHEDEWRDAAHTPKSFLTYKAMTLDGHLIGAPQRQVYEAPVQAIIQASLQSSDDIKATIGLYDASLGQQGNEVSGRAITARKSQGATATFNFVDNLAMGIGYCALIVGELIPVIYDTRRKKRIVGIDGTSEMVTLNGDNPSHNVVNVQYDLVMDAGPSYATQREETSALLTELARQYPKLWDIAGDIAVRNMDFAGAQEISQRLKRTLPPEVVGDDADPQTKLAAASNTIHQMQSALSAATDKINELTTSNQMAEAKLNDKAGELNIRQQEVDIKRKEAEAKLITAGAAAASSKETERAVPLINEALKALGELGAKHEHLFDAVESLAAGGAAPSQPQEPVTDDQTAPQPPTQ